MAGGLAVAVAVVALAWWLTGRDGPRDDPQPVEAEARTARIVTGLIIRDGETRRAISASQNVVLPTGDGASLRLEVDTSRYRLDIWRGDELLKTYPVALGGEPEGAKQRQGDHRTPRGTYVLIPHHPSPGFGSCFYVCYPGLEDAQRGLESGLVDRATLRTIVAALDREALPPHGTALGGLILIHGTRDRRLRPLTASSWTDGCIALENRDVLELLTAFAPSDKPMVTIR